MSSEDLTTITSLAGVLGSFFAGFGLVLTWVGLRQNTRAIQLQVLESIFKDIRELDRQYISEFAGYDHSAKNAWSATFFNTVEYLCFVVNRKITKDDVLKKFFFDDALPAWRNMYDEHCNQGILKKVPESFPEFKKSYRGSTTP